MDSDNPAAGVALTAKGDLDTQRPQERLRAAQAAGKRPASARGFLGQSGRSLPPSLL
jgi:hypothetical protein